MSSPRLLLCKRAYSIRTRIKTNALVVVPAMILPVREHIPLEQGLRPIGRNFNANFMIPVREHIPLEQGLRLSKSKSIYSNWRKW